MGVAPLDISTMSDETGDRWYNPATGPFTTPDTYAGNPNQASTLNRYAYVGNNPVNYVDPTGHYPITVIWITGALCRGIAAGTQHRRQFWPYSGWDFCGSY
jgi:RHS repeat-associated protein